MVPTGALIVKFGLLKEKLIKQKIKFFAPPSSDLRLLASHTVSATAVVTFGCSNQ